MIRGLQQCIAFISAIAAIFLCAPTDAIDRMALSIGELHQSGVSARKIEVRFQPTGPQGGPVSVSIAHVDLGATLGRIEDLRIECPLPVVQKSIFSCAQAAVRGRSTRFGPQNFQASLRWNNRTRSLLFTAAGLRVAGGRIDAEGVWEKRGWSLNLNARSVALAQMRELLGPLLPLPRDWTLAGTLESLSAHLMGQATLQHIKLQSSLSAVSLSNPEGTTATDQLAAGISLSADRIEGAWQFDASLQSAHGEALSGRGYWNFSSQPLEAQGRGQWSDAGLLSLPDAQVALGELLHASANGQIDLAAKPRLRTLEVSLKDLNLAALPPQTRDGIFAGSVVSQLQGAGHFSGRIEVQDDAPVAVDLQLDAVRLEDQSAKLALNGLNGHLLWHSLERRKQALAAKTHDTLSEFKWDNGLLYGVQIGGAQVRFTTAGNDVRLTQSANIPILDGGLAISTLQLRRIGEQAMSIRFDANLEPINVALLCKAFGWPEFAGKLSGRIPDLTLEAGVLTLGGALQASVFDGHLAVSDLKLSDPFGTRPRLQADVAFSRLDLAAVTGAFSFGKITGRIDGRIAAMELVGWEPVAFDATLYTTPKDRTRKRISQRAVQNISSIGGGLGAAAAVQRSVLRFFNEFNYDKLGVSCRLANDICLMQGIEARATGYYLVKGSGLPRIDVIGDSRRVDWPSLVATLKELPESQPSISKSP